MTDTTVGLTESSADLPRAVTVAPYALVRTVALPAPEPSPDTAVFRECAARLVELTLRCERLGPELCDTLYDRARSATADVRSRVLVPLRRDVHNRRSPRGTLRTALAGLDYQSPLLDAWLSARDEIDRTGVRLEELAGSALRADRRALAGLCRSEDLQRAVALTSEDLLRAVQRAALQTDEPDKQARKSEATVLRYAMRAVTRTNPLSWFSHVGWGRWQEDAHGHDPGPTDPFAVARVQRSLLDALVQAVCGRQELRAVLDYRLAPGSHSDGSQLFFRRASPVERAPLVDDAPADSVREEKVALPLTAVLRLVLARTGAGDTVRKHDLAASIASRLPGSPEQAERAAAAYVTALVDQGLLQPAPPFDPQAEDVVREASRWLLDLGFPELAEALAEIGSDTEGYTYLPAKARPECLARIRTRWSAAFALLGAPPVSPRTPLTEDVAVPTVRTLGAGHGRKALPDIARLGPLFELFDGYAVIRRMTRDRFVARFGVGGICDSLADFSDEIVEIWEALDGLDPDGTFRNPDGRPTASRQVRDLLRLRAELAAAVPAAGANDEVVLPEELVDDAARRTPGWLRRRPASYGVFLQPVPDAAGTRLCVNHVYGGWGRFTSRFLDYLDPSAKQQVSAQIAEALGEGERIAQIRPVGGFNANLHPRLVADEVSEGAAWATLQPEQLQLVHDTAGDQVRLRIAATGELVNVLYLGFLLPLVLPNRWMPLLNDLGSGLVHLGKALAPSRQRETALGPIRCRPRLRYRDVILSRAQWRLPEEMVHAWRAELDQGSPVQVTARWRALLGVPEQIFVAAAAPEAAAGMSALPAYLAQSKSQYVDLGSALHLRCLSRTLARYPNGLIIEEALPVPKPGARAVEIVAETYRSDP